MRLDNVAHGRDIDPEVLVNEDIAEATDLRPSDLWVRLGEFCGQVFRGLADDLQVALDGVLGHVDQVGVVTAQCVEIPVATVDRLQDVGDALIGAATYSVTASASADSEIEDLRSCMGKMSMSSRPKRVRISSMRPDARMRRLPSAGFIVTTMSMSLLGPASPRATEPKSRGCVALYFAMSASNSPLRAVSSSRSASVSGVAAAVDMRPGYRGGVPVRGVEVVWPKKLVKELSTPQEAVGDVAETVEVLARRYRAA